MNVKVSRDVIDIDYLRFNNKTGLASGTYRVTEHDGDVNYAAYEITSNWGTGTTTWFSQSEYYERLEMQEYGSGIQDYDLDLDEDLLDSWDAAMHRQNDKHLSARLCANMFPMATDNPNENSEVFDREVFGIVPDDEIEPTVSGCHGHIPEAIPQKTLGELLRESMAKDPRFMNESEYNELCIETEQNRKDRM